MFRSGTIRRRARRGGRTGGMVAVLLVIAAACTSQSGDGDGPDFVRTVEDFEATPAYLRLSAELTASEPHRFEIWGSFTGRADPDLNPPLVRGVEGEGMFAARVEVAQDWDDLRRYLGADGNRDGFELYTAVGVVGFDEFDDAVDALVAAGVALEYRTDDSALYIRAPGMATFLADAATAGQVFLTPGELATFGRLGDRWAYVDLGSLDPGTAAALRQMYAAHLGVDADAVIALIGAATGAESLAASRIRGVPVEGIAADVNAGALLRALGVDGPLLSMVGSDMTLPLAVWVDGDGYLRRINFELDLGAVFRTAWERYDWDNYRRGLRPGEDVDWDQFDWGSHWEEFDWDGFWTEQDPELAEMYAELNRLYAELADLYTELDELCRSFELSPMSMVSPVQDDYEFEDFNFEDYEFEEYDLEDYEYEELDFDFDFDPDDYLLPDWEPLDLDELGWDEDFDWDAYLDDFNLDDFSLDDWDDDFDYDWDFDYEDYDWGWDDGWLDCDDLDLDLDIDWDGLTFGDDIAGSGQGEQGVPAPDYGWDDFTTDVDIDFELVRSVALDLFDYGAVEDVEAPAAYVDLGPRASLLLG